MKNKILLLSLLVFLSPLTGLTQTQTEIDTANFNSGVQNMWGPSWSPFTINQEITLFDMPWNESGGYSAITTLAGQQFGASFNASFSGVMGSKVSLTGFTTGTVEVDYPIEAELVMDQDLTYDQGDEVSIATDYEVLSGYDIESLYPSLGEFKWDFYFQMAASASAQLCFFGCTTFPIIPSFNTGLQTINIATISGNGASTGGQTGAWWLGAGDPSDPFAQEPGINGWPYAWPPQTSGPYNQAGLGTHWIPWQCHLPFFPIDMSGPMGLSGQITLPYVETTTMLQSDDDLIACGDSSYLNVNLEVFKLIGGILQYSPPPGPAIGTVLENLSGSVEVGPAEISWNFFSASFDATIFNNQCFNFEPTIWTRFQFPIPIEHRIWDASASSYSGWSTSSIINVEMGDRLDYNYPCHFTEMDITPTYYIDGTVDNFSNHTYDSIAFNFLLSAFEFGIEVPSVTIVPEIVIPEVCVSIPYPCPTWSNPGRWCSSTVCTPEIVIPAIIFGGIDYSLGPLLDETFPIGDITYDWYNDSWNLEGFSDITGNTFQMRASPLTISNTHQDIDCYGDNTGSINVTIGAINDALPYTYNWVPAPLPNTEDQSNLTAGPYEVMVYDANGCQLFTGATVVEPLGPLSISHTKTDKNCNSGVNDGTISTLVQGGTAPYSYSWTNTAQTSDTITGLDVGTYVLTVTDARGCQEQLTVDITEPNPLGHNVAITDVNCNGGNDGEIAVDTYGGVLPYSYNWSNTATTEDISGLTTGTYTLTITDGNGCTDVGSHFVDEPNAPLSLTSSAIDVACKYDSTGSIDIGTSGGTMPYSYAWSTSGAGGVLLPYTTEDLANIPDGDYTVLVTDANGCQETISQLVAEPANPLSSTPVLTHILCFGDATGVIDPVIAGGTPGPGYTYAWSNGDTNPIATGLVAGTYSLTVTDNNGCTDTYSYTLTEPSQGLSLVLTGVDILCNGDATGSVSTAVDGGTPGYTYLWSNGATTSDITDVIAGNYSVTVTDNNGCTITDNLTLIEPAAPLALSTVVTDVDCYGNNNGAIDLTITGGTGPYTQLWSNSGTVVLMDTTEDISNQLADDYTVLVTDNHGCTETITATINQPAAPLAITGVVDDVNCFGLNDGAIDITVTGGTLNYSYNWSSGQTTEDLTGIIAGAYTVTVTDQNLCTETLNFTVDQPLAPLNIVTFTTDVLCNGGADGIIDSEVTGGTMPYDYLWSNGETTDEIEALTAGVYTLNVTDAQGCTAFTGATINEPPLLVVTPTVTDASCYDYADGQIVIDIVGGVEPYYFNWGNQNDILLNNPSETLTGLIAEDYFIRVTDKNGCINEQVVTVGQPTPFIASHVITDVSCNGGADGFVDVTVSGGTLPYSSIWSDGQTTEDASNLTAGDYDYVITDGQGCIIKDSLTVEEPKLIQVSYDLVPVSCIDQSDASVYVTPYGGTMPYTFLWSTGSDEQNAEGLPPGSYDLTITDDNMCTQVFTFEIMMNYDECLNIPNSFTPNGDNYNDTWVIGNIDLYPNAQVKIFNKWGNEVFSTNGVYEPWDGTHYNNPLPSEVYYYIIILGNAEDNQYTGTVTIIR